jgi:hypothetical protein
MPHDAEGFHLNGKPIEERNSRQVPKSNNYIITEYAGNIRMLRRCFHNTNTIRILTVRDYGA